MDIMVNWEGHISGLVDDIHLIQYANTCWSFGLTRQMNATFRIAQLLGRTESLSVWHFICSMRRMGVLTWSMAIEGLSTAVPFLTDYGLILEEDFYNWCYRSSGLPLPSAPRFPRFVVSEMKIHSLHEYQSNNEFETAFFAALNYSPVATVIPCYPSLDVYRYAPDHVIYSPPMDELFRFHAFTHLILATGRGRLEGIPFVQFRDSASGAFLNVRINGLGYHHSVR